MPTILSIQKNEIALKPEDFLETARYLGYNKANPPDEQVMGMIKNACRELFGVVAPKAVFDSFDLTVALEKGMYAYGYLKCEKGVHRLIRISPFDSGARRHTSFASVDVMPYIEDNIDIEINPNDIRIDIFRSSGNGGQGVNTTDSAIRITHIPTKIVVTCQDERSQIMNKEKAMRVLKSKLYKLEEEKRKTELKEIQGTQKEINFGSQIRSYIMHPYKMVKDHRTNTETSNVTKVLDGDIDIFINDVLKGGMIDE